MNQPPSPLVSSKFSGYLATLVVIFSGLALGYWRMFSHFPGYDDEGYILLTVRDYIAGGGLYESVYSQYGPGFYVLMDLLVGWLGMETSHAAARWFSLCMWFGAAVGCAELVRYLNGSIRWGVGAGAASFMFLYQISEEAFHPGAVVIFIIPWAVRALVGKSASASGRVLAGLVGVATAVLALLKINVGALFGASFVVWYLAVGQSRLPTRGRKGLAVGFGAIAVTILLAGMMTEAWVVAFWFLIISGMAAIVAVAEGERVNQRRELGIGMVVGLVTMLLLVGVVVVRGTSPAALLEGVLLGPLRHADSYSFAVDWRPGTLISGLVALGFAVSYMSCSRRGMTHRAKAILVVIRLVLMVGTGAIVLGLDEWRVFGTLFSYIAPWAWVWVPVLGDGVRGAVQRLARPLLALVLLFQMLHAYPVGGIQICWGSFLWLSLVAQAGPETLRHLNARGVAGSGLATTVGVGLGLVVFGKLGLMSWDYRQQYEELVPVDLPGSGALRLPASQTAAIRTLTINSVLHGDVLFSLPGMFSYNLWSEIPTPNHRNTTLWYRLLDEADQESIIAKIKAAAKPVVIIDWQLLQIATAQGISVSGPLHDYIVEEFKPAFMANQYGFMIKRDRSVAPFGTAWFSEESFEIQVCLLGTESGVEEIQLLDADGSAADLPLLNKSNSKVMVQPIDGAGGSRGAPITDWPLSWKGLAWLTIESELVTQESSSDWSLITFRNEDRSDSQTALRTGY